MSHHVVVGETSQDCAENSEVGAPTGGEVGERGDGRLPQLGLEALDKQKES